MALRKTQFRGCKNLHYAIVTDGESGITIGEGGWKPLAICKTITSTFEQASAKVYGDNKPWIVTMGAGNVTKTFETFAIDPEVVAEITGQKVVAIGEKKAIGTTGGAVAPYIAVGYELYDTDSDSTPCEYVVCYKCKATMPEKTTNTIDDGTDSTGQSLTIECVETEAKFTATGSGLIDFGIPNLGTGYDMSKFFDELVTPDNAETILKTGA